MQFLNCILYCMLVLSLPAQKLSAQNESHSLFRKVEIPNSYHVTFRSAIVGQEYDLYIHLPGNYSDTTRNYPVLYLLDAQWDFSLMTALYGEQYFDGFIPGLIIVGITWGGIDPKPDSLRVRDFTPTIMRQYPQSGKAETFLSFMELELFPYIENQYRTKSKERLLAGSSLGGLFTLYTLFTKPELFNRYIAASPAIGWDDGVLSTFEKKYKKKGMRLPAKVYMAEGALETGANEFLEFAKDLKSTMTVEIEIEYSILRNTGHSGSKAEGFTRGLQFVFSKPVVQVPLGVLKAYEGMYLFRDSIAAQIRVEKNRLELNVNGVTKIFNAETEYDFYIPGQFFELHFFHDSTERKLSGFYLEQFNQSSLFKKNNL